MKKQKTTPNLYNMTKLDSLWPVLSRHTNYFTCKLDGNKKPHVAICQYINTCRSRHKLPCVVLNDKTIAAPINFNFCGFKKKKKKIKYKAEFCKMQINYCMYRCPLIVTMLAKTILYIWVISTEEHLYDASWIYQYSRFLIFKVINFMMSR